jgi:three-Cys-motif partner protein
LSEDFFGEMTEASEIKSEIVSKYFVAWSRVMKGVPTVHKLGYIDLFAGAGRYKDKTPSTPLKVLEHIIGDKDLREMFVTIFNDKDSKIAETLSEEINELPGIDTLKHAPTVLNSEVNEDLVKHFTENKLIPNFAFIDPFGYKGLSLQLINGLTKDWGSDCVFFFNYNRISTGITNIKIEQHIDALFGAKRAAELKKEIGKFKGDEKATFIVNALSESLQENGSNYVLPFQFNKGKRISHYLVFVTKHKLGYKIMKEIMWRASSDYDDGVGNFAFIPVENEQMQMLFSYNRPLDSLGDDLLRRFAGKTLTVLQIFERHNVGTPFIMANYKEALRRLEDDRAILVEPPADKRPQRKGERTFADKVQVTFPE